MGEPGSLCLSSSLTTQPGNVQSDSPKLSQNDIDCTRVAQHVLVLGPGQSITSDSIHASTAEASSARALQQATSPKPQEPEPTCLAPRTSAIQNKGSLMKWQQELRLLRNSQPEPSTSQSGLFYQMV